ncbi:MAG: hypothetical protein WCK67_04330 [bacterium]
MKKSCNKYKTLFIFRESDELMQHLEECADCRNMHEELSGIEQLTRFALPAYQNSKKRQEVYKTNKLIACFLFIFVFSFMFGNVNEATLLHNNLAHPERVEYLNNSIFNKMNLPVDELGLLDINRDFYDD